MAEHSYPELGGKIVLDTSELGKSIKSLQNSISTIRQQSALTINTIEGGEKSVKGLTQKLKDLNAVLKKQGTVVEKYATELDKLIAKEGESSDKVAAKRKSLADAKVSYANTQTQIKNYTEALAKAQEKEKYGIKSIDELGEKVGKFSPKLGTIISKFADWRVVAGSVATALGAAMVKAVNQGIQAFAEYETAFTNVRKTVDGSEADFETLNAEIQQMSQTMPQTAAEIAEVAALGGQLGVAVDSLGEFTETMIKLGDSTTLTADQAGEMIAQIAAITGMTTSDYERFGSAVVELGNNFATTESKMLETTQRISRFSKSVGLNVEEVLALSTALSALGLESDASGTAMQKIFSQIQLAVETTNEDLEGFAKVAGLTTSEFQALWKSSSMKGFQSFIKGMAALDDAGQSTVATLDELGINEVRLTSVLQAITSNTEILDEALEMTNEAWEENTALSEEAAKKYSTYANQVQMTKNTWQLVSQAIGEKFMPVAKAANSISGDLAKTILGIVDPGASAETAIANVSDALDDYQAKAEEAKKKNEDLAESYTALAKTTLVANLKETADAYEDNSNKIEKQNKKIEEYKRKISDISNISLPSYGKDVLENARYIDSTITTLDEAMALVDKINAGESLGSSVSKQKIEQLRSSAETYTNILDNLNNKIIESENEITTYEAKQANSFIAYGKAVKAGLIDIDFVRYYSEELASDVEKWMAVYDRALQSANIGIKYMNEQAVLLTDNKDKLEFYTKNLEQLQKLLASAAPGSGLYVSLALQIEDVKAKQEALNKELKSTEEETEQTTAKYETLAEYIKTYGSEIQKAQLELENLNKDKDNLETLQKKTKEGSDEWNTYASKIELVNKKIEEQTESINKLKDSMTDDFVTKWSDSFLSISKMLSAIETQRQNIYSSLETKAADPFADISKELAQLDYLDTLEEKFNETWEKSFDISDYVSKFGTDAEKTQLKIDEYVKDIEKLQAAYNEMQDEDKKLDIKLAIALETKAKEKLEAELNESGIAAGKTWFEAFAEEMTGGSEAYKKSYFSRWIETFQNSFGKLAEYVGDYWGQITDVLSDRWDDEIDELDSDIDKLDSSLEEKEQQIEQAQTNRQKELDALRADGAISEIAYYKETAKAAEQAEADKAKAEAETAAQKEKLLKEQEALKEKQFNADKINSIAQATINGAQAALKCYTDLGPVAGTVAALTVAGITAAQIATIAKQKYVPALATGGITTGPTYALIGDNTSGQEAVLPLESKTMQLLAGKIVDEMNRPNSNITYNNQKTDDSRSYTINQTITPPGGMTKREAYLQARKALRESRRY